MDLGVSQGFILVQNCQKHNMVSANEIDVISFSLLNTQQECFVPGGLLPYISHIGMCHPIG